MTKWIKLFTVPRGHRFFRDATSGRVAIAGDSGRPPDRCDDGTLWLDPHRSLEIDVRSEYGQVRIPLFAERGGSHHAYTGEPLECLPNLLPLWRELGGLVLVQHLDLLMLIVEAGKEGR